MFCMQKGGGANNPPRQRLLLGQAGPGPAQSSGPGLAQKRIIVFGPKSAQFIFGPRSAQHIWGWVRPSWLGRPSLNLILYIIYIIFCIIYIYMWKITKILQKLF
jgi:hypothetical protein